MVVLLGKHCGGHQNGHLLAVHNRFHDGPEGHLRFAEAHVAAEKPIHGDGGLHILFDVGDAAQLVVRLRIGEIVFKFPLPGGVGRERVAGLPLSGGVELDELSRHILGGLSGFGFGLLPGVGTDFVQADVGVLAAADVFAHQIQLGGRDEKGIRALVGDLDIVLDGRPHLDLFHGHEPANAVVFMNHQVSGSQVCEGVQLLPVGGGFLGGRCLSPGGGFGNELALRQYCQLGQRIFHAVGQGAVGE